MTNPLDRVRQSWDTKATDWDIQVGEAGDRNRRLNSDPVLWRFLGPVAGRRILDAGCGTGYLARQMASGGAQVLAIDLSPEMIRVARSKGGNIEYRECDCGTLAGVPDGVFDAVVSNYVLMDLPHLGPAVRSMFRVLRPGGIAVAVFSHPCFSQGNATPVEGTDAVVYRWEQPYYEEHEQLDPPWAHFKTTFIWFHRPLSVYWRAFRDAGFVVDELDEPHITPERYPLAPDERCLRAARTRPFSIAFRLVKPLG
ncbi:MAG: methyltransferase domain-containing protein [Candidatus Brocadiia bacterium]